MSVIKPITIDNFNSLALLTEELSVYYNGEISPEKSDIVKARSLEYIKNKVAYGYFLDDTLVGYVAIKLLDEQHHNFPNSIFISELFVNKGNRGKGIGKRLVEYVLKKNFNKKYRYFSVTHSPKEIGLTEFYESLGFKYDRVLKSGNIALLKDIEQFSRSLSKS